MHINTRPLLIVTVYQTHWISYPPVGNYKQLSDSFSHTRQICLTFSIWASLRTNQFLNFELRVRHPSTRHSHLINAIRQPTSEVSYDLSSRLMIAHLPSDKDGLHYKSIRKLSWRKFKGNHPTQQGSNDKFQIHWAILSQTIQRWRFFWMNWQDFQELRLLWHDSQVPHNVFTWRRRNLHSRRSRQLPQNLEPNRTLCCSEQRQHDLGGKYLYWRDSSWNPGHDVWPQQSYSRSLWNPQRRRKCTLFEPLEERNDRSSLPRSLDWRRTANHQD